MLSLFKLNKKTPLVICIVSQADALEMYQMVNKKFRF
jgi:hypothetical protein